MAAGVAHLADHEEVPVVLPCRPREEGVVLVLEQPRSDRHLGPLPVVEVVADGKRDPRVRSQRGT